MEKKDVSYKCEKCDFSCAKKIKFLRHIQIHDPDRNKLCDFCDFRTKFAHNLKSHVDLVHKKIYRFKCSQCERTLFHKSDLKVHLKGVHGLDYEVCTYCTLIFENENLFWEHSETFHADKLKQLKKSQRVKEKPHREDPNHQHNALVECTTNNNNKNQDQFSNIKVEIQMDLETSPTPCLKKEEQTRISGCQDSPLEEHNFRNAIKTEHLNEKENEKCIINLTNDGSKATSRDDRLLQMHRKKKSRRRPKRLPIIPKLIRRKKTASENAMRGRVCIQEENVISHSCPVCGKTFKRRGWHKFHVENQICQQEKKTFRTQEESQRQKVFCLKCNREFNYSPNLIRHQRQPCSLEKKVSCHKCKRDFGNPCNLSRHQKHHCSQMTKLSCPKCPSKFETPQTLNKHLEHPCSQKGNRHKSIKEIGATNLTTNLSYPCSKVDMDSKKKKKKKKKFSCSKCEKKFRYRHNIVRHEPESCPERKLSSIRPESLHMQHKENNATEISSSDNCSNESTGIIAQPPLQPSEDGFCWDINHEEEISSKDDYFKESIGIIAQPSLQPSENGRFGDKNHEEEISLMDSSRNSAPVLQLIKFECQVSFKCEFCPLVFQNSVHLDNHVSILHTDNNNYKCKKCMIVFESAWLMLQHYKENHAGNIKLERNN